MINPEIERNQASDVVDTSRSTLHFPPFPALPDHSSLRGGKPESSPNSPPTTWHRSATHIPARGIPNPSLIIHGDVDSSHEPDDDVDLTALYRTNHAGLLRYLPFSEWMARHVCPGQMCVFCQGQKQLAPTYLIFAPFWSQESSPLPESVPASSECPVNEATRL